ncbi:MAG: Eco57I restriction-modification methylase domain-containing protein [Anaerolineae bacterium]
MESTGRSPFTTIRTEGAILPVDLLQRVAQGRDLEGLTPTDYHLDPEQRINEQISQAWARCRTAWERFDAARQDLPATDTGTTLTRERWLLPLFEQLGYGRLQPARGLEIDGAGYPISHAWGGVPIHLVTFRQELDRRSTVETAVKRGPHSLMQEFLNRSPDHLWGLVSNGLRLRLLRDNASLTRQAYVEFDLESMLQGEQYADFAVLWLACHQSRVEGDDPRQFWLERWSQAAAESGTRALEALRQGVEEAIRALGRGFLASRSGAPLNPALVRRLKDGSLITLAYYQQVLRLVYRLIFLFVAEDRGLLLRPDATPDARRIYDEYYSTARLRRLAVASRGTAHTDGFAGLGVVWRQLDGDGGMLGLPGLGSYLFREAAAPDLAVALLRNSDLYAALRSLSTATQGNVRRGVDYRNLGPEELGSVYESLLEMHPAMNVDAGTFDIAVAAGSERKTTGSYYTPSALIQSLLDSALEPVIVDRLRGLRSPEERERAILSIKVVDPACGSGHFLIAAAHRLARELARARTGEEEPAPPDVRAALRDVVAACIHGVDINPMAVELCKINLWLDTLDPGRPLSFLDANIQCGNSLLGATPRALEAGIPDEAFQLITGDVKAVATAWRRQNRQERADRDGGQARLFDPDSHLPWNRLGDLATSMDDLLSMDDSDAGDVRAKEALYADLVRSSGYQDNKLWADAWCAAFLWTKSDDWDYGLTERRFREIERNPHNLAPWMRVEIERLAAQYRFFHWHLAFPVIIRPARSGEQPSNAVTGCVGGFDVVLGNPPYLDSEYMTAALPRERQLMAFLYESTTGNWDQFVPFVELAAMLTKPGGFHGQVTPNKLLGADYCAVIQALLLERRPTIIHDYSDLDLFHGASIAVITYAVHNVPGQEQDAVEFRSYGAGPAVVKQAMAALGELRLLPSGYISFPITCDRPQLIGLFREHLPLSEHADLSDGATTGEAYEIKEIVSEGISQYWHDARLIKLVNTGTIDPYLLGWGREPISYLGFKGRCPVILPSDLRVVSEHRYQQAMVEKVVVAGLSRTIEAAVAPTSVLCGKSAVLVIPREGVCPYAICTVLNSAIARQMYGGMFAMRGMGKGSLNVGPRQLEQIPMPPASWLIPSTITEEEVCQAAVDLTEVDVLEERAGSPGEAAHVLSVLGRALHILAPDSPEYESLLQFADSAVEAAYGLGSG